MASESSYVLRPGNLSCELEHPWDDGLSLYNFINSVSMHGLTGNIQFSEGRRTNFKLDLLKLKKEKLRPVGYWTSDTGIHITDTEAFYDTQVHNITLTVMTRVVSGKAVVITSDMPYKCPLIFDDASYHRRSPTLCCGKTKTLPETTGSRVSA